MPHSKLLDSLIFTTQYSAGFVLRRYRRIVPAAVHFVHEDDPHVHFCFPLEGHPQASSEAHQALAEEWLRDRATRHEAVRPRYPIQKRLLGWSLGKPEEDGEPPRRYLI